MNTVTFFLESKHFYQYLEDAKFLGLKIVSTSQMGESLTLVLSGSNEMLKTFRNWLDNAKNWTDEALEDAKIMAEAEYYLAEVDHE